MGERLRERFLSKVRIDPATGCWQWCASTDGRGYGTIQVDGANRRAHRISYGLFRGPVPADLCVCHHCDNRGCVNPDHLFLGTNQDNVDDRNRKQRTARGLRSGAYTHPERLPRGQRNGLAKLTPAAAAEIRQLYAAGGVSQTALARRFGVSQVAVSLIIRGRTWRPTVQEAQS